MSNISLVFWLCTLGTTSEDPVACDRVALPWYGTFWACQMHGQAEIADWLRKAGREGERVARYRCTIEPVPQTYGDLARADRRGSAAADPTPTRRPVAPCRTAQPSSPTSISR
jgi:hypothetical protein